MKKEREKKILKEVYSSEQYNNVKSSEQPDFIITAKDRFGVEVTEFFVSESSARLHNIPNYVSDIILKNIFRDKDDKETLKPDDYELIDEDKNNSFKFRGILTPKPNIENFRDMIAQTIEGKDLKFEKYDNSLDYINLIIFDNDNCFKLSSISEFTNNFFEGKLLDVLKSTNFGEIFLLSNLDKTYNNIPLRMLYHIVNNIYLKLYYFKELKNKPNERVSFELYIQYLKRSGFKNIYCNPNNMIVQIGIYKFNFIDQSIIESPLKLNSDDNVINILNYIIKDEIVNDSFISNFELFKSNTIAKLNVKASKI